MAVSYSLLMLTCRFTRRPSKNSWHIPHYLYLFSRYFGILSQMCVASIHVKKTQRAYAHVRQSEFDIYDNAARTDHT